VYVVIFLASYKSNEYIREIGEETATCLALAEIVLNLKEVDFFKLST